MLDLAPSAEPLHGLSDTPLGRRVRQPRKALVECALRHGVLNIRILEVLLAVKTDSKAMSTSWRTLLLQRGSSLSTPQRSAGIGSPNAQQFGRAQDAHVVADDMAQVTSKRLSSC